MAASDVVAYEEGNCLDASGAKNKFAPVWGKTVRFSPRFRGQINSPVRLFCGITVDSGRFSCF
jgi:hypothetical protein